MRSRIQPSKMKTLMQFFSRSMRRNIQQLFVDQQGLAQVKKLINNDEHVVLMPFHKSFSDAIIFNATNLMQGLPAMYTFGCSEDTPQIQIFDKWLSSMGYIRSNRSEDQLISSYYLNSALLTETVEHNKITMLYQNSQRLRSGKINRKQTADMAIRWLLEAYLSLKEKNKNIHVVPVMINYDRIYEPNNLSSDMLGVEQNKYNFYSALEKMITTTKDGVG